METNNFSPAHSEVFKSSDNEILSEKSLIISSEGKSYLLTTAKWSGFIAIVGFAMIAIMVFGSLVAFFISPLLGEFQDFQMFQYMPMPFYFFGFFYLLMALICFFPYYYLYLFSKKTKTGMLKNDQQNLNEGFKNLKKTAKFVGIVTVISLALMLLIIPIMIFSIGMLQALSSGVVV